MNARVACANIIAAVLRNEASLNSLLPRYLEQIAVSDRALVQEICYGTLRWYPALEVIINSLVDKPFKAKDAELNALLAAALYQLREMRIPSHAAVNEAVAACKPLKRLWAKGLVNGVLRRYLREHSTLESRWQQDLRYQTAHPSWLYEQLSHAWPDPIDRLIAANNSRAPMTLRVNRLHNSREHYLHLLAQAGIQASPTALSPVGISLQNPISVENLPGFNQGWVSVQDEASQLCTPLLNPVPGARVLDACCAPGGKTGHLLEYQADISELVALDIDAQRLTRVQQNLDRLQLKATLKTCDAADLSSWWDGTPFDTILLDAPCSATGVIRRHPDIKLLRRPADIDKLATLQGALLQTLWGVLKPGGRLLYTTCSVLPQENDQVIAAFIARQDDCQPASPAQEWNRGTGPGLQLLPETGGHDGFYFCLLEKVATSTTKGTQ